MKRRRSDSTSNPQSLELRLYQSLTFNPAAKLLRGIDTHAGKVFFVVHEHEYTNKFYLETMDINDRRVATYKKIDGSDEGCCWDFETNQIVFRWQLHFLRAVDISNLRVVREDMKMGDGTFIEYDPPMCCHGEYVVLVSHASEIALFIKRDTNSRLETSLRQGRGNVSCVTGFENHVLMGWNDKIGLSINSMTISPEQKILLNEVTIRGVDLDDDVAQIATDPKSRLVVVLTMVSDYNYHNLLFFRVTSEPHCPRLELTFLWQQEVWVQNRYDGNMLKLCVDKKTRSILITTNREIRMLKIKNSGAIALLLGLHPRAGRSGVLNRVTKRSSAFDPQVLGLVLRLAGLMVFL